MSHQDMRGAVSVPFDGYAVAAIVAAVARDLSDLRRTQEVEIVARGPEGPTTIADIQAQVALIDGLLEHAGPAEILAEEGDQRGKAINPTAPLTWIIDPIDGTSGYLAGSDRYGVQVAAYGAGRILGAWICCPELGWHLAAWEGSTLLIDASPQASTDHHMVVIADGDFDPEHRALLADRNIKYGRSQSCAVDYAMLSAGRLDAAVYRRTHPWDHAPGAYLVHRAGGVSRRWNGEPYDPGIVAEGIVSVASHRDPLSAGAYLPPRQDPATT